MSKNLPDAGEKQEAETVEADYPLIEFPQDQDIVVRLQAKLGQYRERLLAIREDAELAFQARNPYKAPEQNPYTPDRSSLKYKIAIVEQLLAANGPLSATAVIADVTKKVPPFYPQIFKEAWAVIKDYVEKGGTNIRSVGGF